MTIQAPSFSASEPNFHYVIQPQSDLAVCFRHWLSVCCALTGLLAEEHHLQCRSKVQHLVQKNHSSRRDSHSGGCNLLYLCSRHLRLCELSIRRSCLWELQPAAHIKAWRRAAAQLTRSVQWSERALTVQDAESATHVVIGEKHEALETLSLPIKARVVTSEWLEDCLSKQRRLPEREYAADPEELAKEADSEHSIPFDVACFCVKYPFSCIAHAGAKPNYLQLEETEAHHLQPKNHPVFTPLDWRLIYAQPAS